MSPFLVDVSLLHCLCRCVFVALSWSPLLHRNLASFPFCYYFFSSFLFHCLLFANSSKPSSTQPSLKFSSFSSSIDKVYMCPGVRYPLLLAVSYLNMSCVFYRTLFLSHFLLVFMFVAIFRHCSKKSRSHVLSHLIWTSCLVCTLNIYLYSHLSLREYGPAILERGTSNLLLFIPSRTIILLLHVYFSEHFTVLSKTREKYLAKAFMWTWSFISSHLYLKHHSIKPKARTYALLKILHTWLQCYFFIFLFCLFHKVCSWRRMCTCNRR